MELIELKERIKEFLETEPELAYTMDELAEQFNEERWLIQKAVSQLDDERVIRIRVQRGVVYAHIKEGKKSGEQIP